jgi:hypothetical protein
MLKENPNKIYFNLSITPDATTIGCIDKHNPHCEIIFDEISRLLMRTEINKGFQHFWKKKKNDKLLNERKLMHSQFIQSYTLKNYLSEIDKIGRVFAKHTFDCKDGVYPLSELTKEVSKYFNPIFFDRILNTKIKITQPVEGPGENYLWSLFSNLDFAQSKGDLVDTINNYKIEVKGDSGSLGSNTTGREWNEKSSKDLCSLIDTSISEKERTYLMKSCTFGTEVARCLETALKSNPSDQVLEKICYIISNYNDIPKEDIKSFIQLVRLKPDYQNILKLVIALHMKLYSEDENFDKLFLFNGGSERSINKLIVMTAKQDIYTLLTDIDKYNITSKNWGAGKKGIRIAANI